MSEHRAWALDMFGGRPMTINRYRTLHQSPRAKFDKATRNAWADLTRREQVPHLEAARFVVTPLHENRASPQDVAACAPEAKAAIDGIVDAGVLDDDDPVHLLSIMFLPPWVCGANGMRIRVTEADPVPR